MAKAEKRICIRAPRTTMHDLNDDVLRETFAHLKVKELSVIADVCSTFRRVAQQEFASRHKKVILRERLRAIDESGDCEVHIGNSQRVSFFRKFGSVITSIRMKTKYPRHHVSLAAIAKYCSESLVELDLTGACWTNEMNLEWRPLLSQLQKLTLRACKSESDAETSQMLSFCDELHSLTIMEIEPMNFGSPVTLPQLNSLVLDRLTLTNQMILNWQPSLARVKQLELKKCGFQSGANASQLLSFCAELHSLSLSGVVSRNILVSIPGAMPQLKILDLSEVSVAASEHLLAFTPQLEEISLPCLSRGHMFEMVSRYVPNIVKMKFGHGEKVNVDYFKIFKNLKSLDIYSSEGSSMPVLKAVAEAAIPLERLRLRASAWHQEHAPVEDLIQQILRFEHLREFEMDLFPKKLPLSDILTIVQNLPDLNKLSLECMNFPFAEIPEIIKCGPKLQSLTYKTDREDYIDNDSFLSIRDAVVHYSEFRPVRLIFGPTAYEKLKAVRKLVKANSDFLQFERAENWW